MSQPEDLLDREARSARNQSLFREINERIQRLEGDPGYARGLVAAATPGWLCECANQSCFERIIMSHEAYEAIRQHGARFLVAAGDDHFVPDLERLIEQNDHYWTVEKTGESKRIAKRFDPRSRALHLTT
jgi:hypothetical protein